MAIVQTIEYKSDFEYFMGFLSNLIDMANIKGYVTKEDNKIKLVLDDSDEEALEEFSKLSNKYLPYSVFLGDIETNVLDIDILDNNFKSKVYEIAPCLKCIEDVSTPSSKYYLDDSYVCKHYKNKDVYISNNTTTFSPHYTFGSTLLITDSTQIDDLFIITEDEKKVLFSIEKPSIRLTIKDEELKEITKLNYIYVKAPYDLRSLLVSINAKDSEIPYLFFNCDDLRAIVVKDDIIFTKANRLFNLMPLNEDKKVNLFLNITEEANFKKAIGGYLSYTNGIRFFIRDNGVEEVYSFNDFDYKRLVDEFKKDEIRSKLWDNFNKKFPLDIEDIDFYGLICKILEIDYKDDPFFYLSNKSLEFKGNGGLKIDLEFNDEGFDYKKFFSSIMSFKLAETNSSYIAYSVFEAFGDFAINIINRIKVKYNLPNNIVYFGNMFENTILYARIISKMGANKPYFSKNLPIDV